MYTLIFLIKILILLFIYDKIEDIVARAIVIIHILSTEEDMILYWYGEMTKKLFGDYWSKAFSQCPTCMVSVYWIAPLTIGLFTYAFYTNLSVLLFFPLIIFSALSLSYKTTKLAISHNLNKNKAVLSSKEVFISDGMV